ncbi:MAG TPA: LacI family DNA-binding transcriptional regulator [Phototrophicaceae bacterium]|nr:LacI family DNA-binding transcriptional regulator [Phototrophicaceae bacterium]
MKSKLPTMRDVAKLAGVSQPTVSRVLNQNDTTVPISDETRQRVQAAIDALGYRPNVVARSLRTQRTQMIALLIADISNGFYHPLTRAIQDVARQRDYEVLIANSDHIYENEKHFCDIVLRRGVDGAIMVPIHLTTAELSHFMEQAQTPVAVLAEQIDHPQIDVVYVDDEVATYEATCWLIAQRGYKTIGFVGVPDYYPPGPRRRHGFVRAMTDFGLTPDLRFAYAGDFTVEGGKKIAHTLIESGEIPSALMVINDLMAIGIMLALQDAGYAVPEEVAVMGFDDIPETQMVRPTLTTIAQNPRDIGIKLAHLLFDRIENPDISAKRLTSSCQLIPRQSA